MIKGTGYQNGQKLKKSIPEYFVKKLKSDDNEKIKKSLGLFSSTSTIFFSKMLLKMCINSSKTCLIL
jgi:hypothetical protein